MNEPNTTPGIFVVGRSILMMGLAAALATMTLTGLVAAFVLLSGAVPRA